MIRIASPTQDAKAGVNEDRNGINGLIIAEEGPFKSGRGRFNLQSLERIVALGNAASDGIRKRAQHPNASDDGLGSGCGRETNYRIDKRPNGSHIVRADMLFSKAGMTMNPKGKTAWGPYLMSELEENRNAFQNSIVLKFEIAEDELSDNEELPDLWMPVELKASDFVDTGDAVHGDSLSEDDMISWLNEGSSRRTHVKLTQVLSTQLDRAFPDAEPSTIQARLHGFVDRYLSNRFDGFQPSTLKEPPVDKEIQEALAAQRTAFEGQLSEVTKSIGTLTDLVKSAQESSQQALAAKTRSEEIAALCQQAGSTEAASFIADASLSVADVQKKLFTQLCENTVKLGEGEGDVAPTAWEKLNAEWRKDEADLQKAGWTMDDWKAAKAAERNIEIPSDN